MLEMEHSISQSAGVICVRYNYASDEPVKAIQKYKTLLTEEYSNVVVFASTPSVST